MSNYDSDDVFPRSPGLEPVRPKATPSPSPPPFAAHSVTISTSPDVSPPYSSSRRRKKPNRRKTQPSQGDTVLIGFMDPNRPDIARLVGEKALNSESGSDADDEEMVSEEPAKPDAVQQSDRTVDLEATARIALQTAEIGDTAPPGKDVAPQTHRDSVIESQPESEQRPIVAPSNPGPTPSANGVRMNGNGVVSKSATDSFIKLEATSPNVTGGRAVSFANGYPPEDDSLATSPTLRELAIPESQGSPSQKLPALQNPNSPSRDGPTGSPNQERRLPSFRHLSELAETAINEQNESRTNGFLHRPSISSTGQSPPLIHRTFSISSQRSPATGFPPLSSATSPLSAHSEFSSPDVFIRSGAHSIFSSTRRPSQASENGPPFSGTLPSASVTDGYQSSDNLSPGSQPTPIENRTHRMSLDSALSSRTLPLPTGPLIQHIPPSGSGGFKCDYPGCTAPPFQTQYLLKYVIHLLLSPFLTNWGFDLDFSNFALARTRTFTLKADHITAPWQAVLEVKVVKGSSERTR